jgi:hypothetical protein
MGNISSVLPAEPQNLLPASSPPPQPVVSLPDVTPSHLRIGMKQRFASSFNYIEKAFIIQ